MRMTTDAGGLIRTLRDKRGITRKELAELAEVSLSHLEKVETGQRSPGMGTFIKIMVILDVTISLHNSTGGTVQEQCATAVGNILVAGSEGQARYLTQMVECMAGALHLVI